MHSCSLLPSLIAARLLFNRPERRGQTTPTTQHTILSWTLIPYEAPVDAGSGESIPYLTTTQCHIIIVKAVPATPPAQELISFPMWAGEYILHTPPPAPPLPWPYDQQAVDCASLTDTASPLA